MTATSLADEQDRLSDAGFSEQQVIDWSIGETKRLRDAGFSQEEIDIEFDIHPFDKEEKARLRFNKNVQKAFDEGNLQKFDQNVEKTTGQPVQEANVGIPGVPKFDPNATGFDPVINAGDPNFPKPAISFLDYVIAGWQISLAGLQSRGKLPDRYVPENANLLEQIASGVGTLSGDALGFIFGGMLGAKAPVPPQLKATSAAIVAGTAFWFTETLREIYIDEIKNGSIENWEDFWSRAAPIAIHGFKALGTGGAVGLVGAKAKSFFSRTTSKFGPKQPIIQSPVGNFSATLATEVATLVTIGNALEGKLPSGDQIGAATAVMFGFKLLGRGGHASLRKMRKTPAFKKVADIWRNFDVDPDILARDANQYADIFQDLNSRRSTPRAYEPANSRTDENPSTTTVVKQLANSLRSARDGEPSVDSVTKIQKNMRAELKKQGFSQEAIDTQVAESTQEAVDRVADHTVVDLVASEKTGDVGKVSDAIRAQRLIRPVDQDIVEDVLVPIKERFTKLGFSKEEVNAKANAIRDEAIRDMNETESKVFGELGISPPKISADVKTGQPFIQTLIRGQGRADSGVNAGAPQGGALGSGRYTTDNLEYAQFFGPNLTTHIVNLKNPLVIRSDQDWRALIKRAGWEFPNQMGLKPDQQAREIDAMRSMLREEGHDGIIIKVPQYEYDPATGLSGKTMQRVFGESQVIEFDADRPSKKQVAEQKALAAGGAGGKPPEPPPAKPGDFGGAVGGVLDHVSIGDHGPRGGGLTAEQVFASTLDDIAPINNDIISMFGENTEGASTDPYKGGRIYRGIMAKAGNIIDYGPIDFFTFDRTGPGLTQILHPIRTGEIEPIEKGKGLDELRAYALGKDAIDSMSKGVDVGFDMDQVRTVVNDKSAIEKYEPVTRKWVEFQNQVAVYAKDAGLITQEGLDWMIRNNPNHVPMYKVLDKGEWTGIARSGQIKNPFKKRKGGPATIADPIESTVKNIYALVALADRNVVGQNYINLADKSGRAELYYKEITPKLQPIKITDKEMKKWLRDNHMTEVPQDLMTIYRAAVLPVAINEIVVYRDGKRHVYEVRPETAEAFKHLDRPAVEMWLKVASLPAKTLRAGTVISPEFIIRNFLRDQVFAMGMSKGTFFEGYVPVLDFIRGLLSIVGRDDHFMRFLLSGGANSNIVAVDRLYIEGKIGQLADKTGIGRDALNILKTPLQVLGAISEEFENATRIGVFRKALTRIGKEEAKAKGIKYDPNATPSKAAIQQAGFEGRNNVTDFQRKGSNMYAMSKLVAFFNPHLQGMLRLVEGLRDDPIATSSKFFFAITLPAVMLWLNNHDDPRHEQTPQWIKDMYFIIYTEKTTYRIAKSHEAGVLFASLMERVLDAVFKGDDEGFKHFRRTLWNVLLPSLIPTIGIPIIEQFSNRSTFTGRPIIPRQQEKFFPEYQFKPYTNELSKEIARTLGAFPGVKRHAIEEPEGEFTGGFARLLTSPTLIDNYVRAWFGGIGVYIMDLTDWAMRQAGLIPNPIRPSDTLADIPFIKAFIVRDPSSSNQLLQDFWERYAVRMKSFATLRMLVRKDDFAAEERVLQFDPGAENDLSGHANLIREHAKEIRDLMDMAQEKKYAPEDITAARDQLRQNIDQIYVNMIDVARQALIDMDRMDKGDVRFDRGRGERSLFRGPAQRSPVNQPSREVPQTRSINEPGGNISPVPSPQPGSPIQ